MNASVKAGQLLYGLAILAFGIEFFVFHSSLLGLMPLPAAFNVAPWIYIPGFLLVAGGVCILFHLAQKTAALLLALLLFALCLWLHVPSVVANPANGSQWTGMFELIAMSSGALFSAINAERIDKVTSNNNKANNTLYLTAIIIFIASLVVFGILHFVYAAFIATLLPAWMPVHLFWAYFVGFAFTATALSLVLSVFVKLSTSLLAVMFFLWVVLLHGPRVIANLHSEPEWTSFFVALSMGGIALQLAGLINFKQKKRLIKGK